MARTFGDMGGQKQKLDPGFSHTPFFYFYDGDVRFNANGVADANANYGSASGFLPKSSLAFKIPTDTGVF